MKSNNLIKESSKDFWSKFIIKNIIPMNSIDYFFFVRFSSGIAKGNLIKMV